MQRRLDHFTLPIEETTTTAAATNLLLNVNGKVINERYLGECLVSVVVGVSTVVIKRVNFICWRQKNITEQKELSKAPKRLNWINS